ncbi:hypothetical protein E8E11_010339 [Didymella keratinophila]|nr:hypothetical protein E8E11_010339 [Didymella keratinophila]
MERVISTISDEQYTSKRFLVAPRSITRRFQQAIIEVERELSALKKPASHKHNAKLSNSWTKPSKMGDLMLPAGEISLEQYLTRTDGMSEPQLLFSLFGCLASALALLHHAKIRYNILKPLSILIKGDLVFLTSLDYSLDWSELDSGISEGPPSGYTRYYAAPEVLLHYPRGTASDIWSLGVIFLKIWTALNGESIEISRDFTISDTCGTDNRSAASRDWLKKLKSRLQSPLPEIWIDNEQPADASMHLIRGNMLRFVATRIF